MGHEVGLRLFKASIFSKYNFRSGLIDCGSLRRGEEEEACIGDLI
jgi:hypothetical protein